MESGHPKLSIRQPSRRSSTSPEACNLIAIVRRNQSYDDIGRAADSSPFCLVASYFLSGHTLDQRANSHSFL